MEGFQRQKLRNLNACLQVLSQNIAVRFVFSLTFVFLFLNSMPKLYIYFCFLRVFPEDDVPRGGLTSYA